MESKKASKRYSPEVRARAVRMVLENQGDYATQSAAIAAIAPKIGCHTGTLRLWIRHEEVEQGSRAGMTPDECERMKELARENRELRQANEILKKAPAYFALPLGE